MKVEAIVWREMTVAEPEAYLSLGNVWMIGLEI